MFQSGLGISARFSISSFAVVSRLFERAVIGKVLSAFCFMLGQKWMRVSFKHIPLAFPLFILFALAIFYLVIMSAHIFSLDAARRTGWIFPTSDSPIGSFYEYYAFLNLANPKVST